MKVRLEPTERFYLKAKSKKAIFTGFTENYVKVKTPWNPELVNTLHDIQLTKIDEDGSAWNGICYCRSIITFQNN